MNSSSKFVKSVIKNSKSRKVGIKTQDWSNVDYNPNDYMDTLDLLLDSVYDVFKSDNTKPGVLVSKIGKGSKKFYASILRFTNGAKQRNVVLNTIGKDKQEAIEKLAKKWVEMQKPEEPTPTDQLKNYLNRLDI